MCKFRNGKKEYLSNHYYMNLLRNLMSLLFLRPARTTRRNIGDGLGQIRTKRPITKGNKSGKLFRIKASKERKSGKLQPLNPTIGARDMSQYLPSLILSKTPRNNSDNPLVIENFRLLKHLLVWSIQSKGTKYKIWFYSIEIQQTLWSLSKYHLKGAEISYRPRKFHFQLDD